MPFKTDEELVTEASKIFGEYLISFRSESGQVRADVFRKGKTVAAHVSFPTGLDASKVTDPYVSALWDYARKEGFADQFKLVLS